MSLINAVCFDMEERPILTSLTVTGITLLVIPIVMVIWLMAVNLPPAVDYGGVFRPAALATWRTGNPYVRGFYNAPWAILPLMPLALLPEAWGRLAHVVLSLVSIAYVAKRLGASPTAMALILLSPPALHGMLNGNIDWLVILGFVLPPQVGLFFLVIKPQMGMVLAVYYAIQAWRERRLIRTVAPVTIALLLSFLVYGPWPLLAFGLPDRPWNSSLWPYAIPAGIALAVAAFRKHKAEYAFLASPCLSPYVMLHSWIGGLLAISKSVPRLAAAVAGLWALCALVGVRLMK